MVMLHRPLVSVITINFNQAAYTLQMIDSLKRCGYENLEIIVVDNASNNNDVEAIATLHHDVKVLRLSENLGFAGGNNKGLEQAKGEYFLFLNNDTEVSEGFIEPLIAVFEQFPDAGMVSPRIHYFDSVEMKTIQYAGARKINLLTGRGSNIGWGETDMGQYNYVLETDYAHGAALMFNRRILKQLGCIPDQYFLYYEEHDWCTAMQRVGLKAYFCGKSVIFHKESISVGKNSPLKTYYMNRNRIMYLRRNASFVKFSIAILFYSFVSLPIAIIRFVLKRDFSHIKYYLWGISWHFTHGKVIKGFPQIENLDSQKFKLTNESNLYKEHIAFMDRLKSR